MAYFRYEWVVQEFGENAELGFLRPEIGDDTKAQTIGFVKELFEPGNVVQAAYAADHSFEG